MAAAQLVHERLSRLKALSIIGSDPLSSSTYATEEALLVLVLAGAAGMQYSLPIALVVAALLVVVAISYRQTVRAYPSGGGAYAVAHDNLGVFPGLTAGGALMVDYVLLVSVSVAAGVAAITSAVPEVGAYTVPLAVLIVGVFTVGNLRGVRESGTIFTAPTYFFLLLMGAAVIAGFVRVIIGDAPGTLTSAAPPREEIIATQGITLWLVLRAFSGGGAALTGIEAIANGVPTFKSPEAHNARATLAVLAFLGVFLFVGITFVSSRYGIVPSEDETVVSQMGRLVFGQNVLYYSFQAATAMILFMAANTSFNAFPLLSAVLARDRYMPRQFNFRGDRLAYSNGILLLSAIAVGLLIIFAADVHRLIPLYAVGVFLAFTLSQSGMSLHWWRLREAGWRSSLAINGTGAVITGVVAVIITATKFSQGAFVSVILIGILIVLFTLIRRHYDWFERRISVDQAQPPVGVPSAVTLVPSGGHYLPPRDHVVVPVDGVNKISLGAVAVARELSRMVTAVHLTDNKEEAEAFRERWNKVVPDIPLLIIESPYRAFVAPLLAYIESLEQTELQRIVVILPRYVPRHWWERMLHNRDIERLRPFLAGRESIRVVDYPYRIEDGR
jgi:amino acid transporter